MATEPTDSVLGPGDGAPSESGMPQLNFETFPNQIFWLLLALVAIYLILSRIALPRIGAVLAERQGTITNDIAAAEELKQKAAEAERAYEKALADARSEAGRIIDKNRAELQADVDAAMATADAEIAAQIAESQRRIEQIRANAMADVEQVAKEVTGSVVEAMGGDVDPSQIDSAVDDRLKERVQ